MIKHTLCLFSLLSFSFAIGGPQIVTSEGIVEGFETSKNHVFLGVPFAAPPVGPLRWNLPAHPRKYTGVMEAKHFKSDCTQLALSNQEVKGSEDCLYLNLWLPKNRSKNNRVPLMLYLPGGANINGAASNEILGIRLYEGDKIASHGEVAVVTINYRLGALGFLAQKDGPRESNLPIANFGLHDIVAALRWVRNQGDNLNIDLDKITLFGESAGAWNTCALTVSPQAKGLFQTSIMESGVCSEQPLERSLKLSEALKNSFQCQTIDCMRSVPAGEIINAAKVLAGTFDEDPISTTALFYPIVGAALRELSAFELIKQRKGNDIPVILGTNQNELLLPASTDEGQTCGTFALANVLAGNQSSSVFRYEFSHRPLYKTLPVLHGTEVLYLFGGIEKLYPNTTADKTVSKLMRSYWTTFAKGKNPNTPGTSYWPRHKTTSPYYLEITENPTIQFGSATNDFSNCKIPN